VFGGRPTNATDRADEQSMMSSVTSDVTDIAQYCDDLSNGAVNASRTLATLAGSARTAALVAVADALVARSDEIVEANAKDLGRSGELGLSEAMTDRLRLDGERVLKMADSVRQIAGQVDPVGQTIEGYVRPNGLRIEKRRVPIGVVLIIYESRPNVTSDAAALCLKSGNAVILRGGKESIHSNTAIAGVIRDALHAQGLDPDMVQMVETTDRAAVGELLKMEGRIDLAIPRGGKSLIRAVVEQAHIPVIKHYTGNCHMYVDASAGALGEGLAREVCVNAKVQRTGVCNAVETMLFHADVPQIQVDVCRALAAEGVELRVCERSRKLLEGHVADNQLVDAVEDDWHAEYLDKICAVRVVDDLGSAISHINQYGSHHTDGVLAADISACNRFINEVDAADIMVNCSTRFSDGGEFGLGAEIGISTDKLHARGPMGAADLTTYKWIVTGHGQCR
jgi:glutamate-5-semialdehyde dehydrogenase